MLIIDLPSDADFQSEAQMQSYYPEEVWNAGWNPVLEEIHNLQTKIANSEQVKLKPADRG